MQAISQPFEASSEKNKSKMFDVCARQSVLTELISTRPFPHLARVILGDPNTRHCSSDVHLKTSMHPGRKLYGHIVRAMETKVSMPINPAPGYFLMKAEPDSRIVKGKDVKFSVDDFEAARTTEWDGVRNHEAKNLMKNLMKIGHQVLFYHSNTKQPGVFGIAKIIEEGHPDESAFDVNHPYYDPKSKRESPTWYTPTLEFVARLTHPILLSDFKRLATLDPNDLTRLKEEGFGMLTSEEIRSIQEMPLLNRGRLSVQTVSDLAFHSIIKLGETGIVSHPALTAAADVASKNRAPKPKAKPTVKSKSKPDLKPSLNGRKEKNDSTGKDDKSGAEEKRMKRIGVSTEKDATMSASMDLRRSKRRKV